MGRLTDKPCKQCGDSFMGGPRSLYCPTCKKTRGKVRSKNYYKRKKDGSYRPVGSIDKCVSCGFEYIVSSAAQKYCPECKLMQTKRNTSGDSSRPSRKICKKCGVSFETAGKHTLYCESCRAEAYAERRKNRRNALKENPALKKALGDTKTCEICSKEFVLTNPKQKYCPECRNDHKKIYDHKAKNGKRYSIVLSPKERDVVENEAKRLKMSPADYIRYKILMPENTSGVGPCPIFR